MVRPVFVLVVQAGTHRIARLSADSTDSALPQFIFRGRFAVARPWGGDIELARPEGFEPPTPRSVVSSNAQQHILTRSESNAYAVPIPCCCTLFPPVVETRMETIFVAVTWRAERAREFRVERYAGRDYRFGQRDSGRSSPVTSARAVRRY